MERPIMTSELFLSQPSADAGADDLDVAQDLLDTLTAHRERCVGMAANMIGVRKRLIVFVDGSRMRAMLNPEIVSHGAAFETAEGCLSLEGERPCTRWRTIKVRYQDLNLQEKTESFSGFTAQIIQHEIDHTNGIVI